MSRKISLLDRSLRVNGIILILETAKRKRTFSELFLKSKIYLKQSFLRYLRYCIQKGFISYTPYKTTKRRGDFFHYSTTKKGRQLLDILDINLEDYEEKAFEKAKANRTRIRTLPIISQGRIN